MTQQSIPIQLNETAVTAALRQLAIANAWCVTHTTDGNHASTSLHYVGRAVDLASFLGPGTDTPELLTINLAVLKVLPIAQVSELIYAGPGNICVKDGKVVAGLSFYGAATMAEHHNHVHLGVIPTFTFAAPATKVVPMFDPPLQVVDVLANPHGSGGWMLLADGGIGAIPPCPWRGIDNQPLGKSYWGARRAARLEPLGDGYRVIDTAGEHYDFP